MKAKKDPDHETHKKLLKKMLGDMIEEYYKKLSPDEKAFLNCPGALE